MLTAGGNSSFFATSFGGTLDVDAFPALPGGILSYNPNTSLTADNTPKNFANVAGHVVPEPSTLVIALGGLLALGCAATLSQAACFAFGRRRIKRSFTTMGRFGCTQFRRILIQNLVAPRMLLQCVAVAAVLSTLVGCSKYDPKRSGTGAGLNSKNLSSGLVDLEGDSFDFRQQKPAQATVVLFALGLSDLEPICAGIGHLYDVFQPRGVAFFLIYVDPNETPEAIRQHLLEYNYPCQALRDPQHALVAYCKAATTPEAVVFNRDWNITYRGRINDRYADVGQARQAPTTHELADAIESTVLGRPVATPLTKAVGCPIADLHN